MPARIDLAQLALRTLEDALAQVDAAQGPIQRSWGQRLALAWLAHDGIAEAWQCRAFWQEIADTKAWAHRPEAAHYMRTTSLHGLLDCWHRRVGEQPPSLLQRARWASAYAPELDSDGADAMLAAMCNLYRLKTPAADIADLFKAVADQGLNAASEVYPGYKGLVVASGKVRAMTWGFPVVLKGKNGQPLKPKAVNNARFDKLNGFWRRWAAEPAHRCLIPFNAYAEAVGPKGAMTRTWLSVADAPVAAWAGLWRSSDEWGDCYTGVMTDNAPELAHIHDRSPVILEPHEWQAWLTEPLPALMRFDRPFAADRLVVQATADRWAARSAKA